MSPSSLPPRASTRANARRAPLPRPAPDAWAEALAQAASRPDLRDRLTRPNSDLRLRFGETYSRLSALPRAQRRRLQRNLRTGLAGVALLLALGLAPTSALALPPGIIVDGTTCTLADAITTANTGTNTGGCTGGSVSADTIDLQTDVNLTAALPDIASEIVLEGNGHTIQRTGGGAFSVLNVVSGGNLTLKRATISGGSAYSGGGIRNSYGMLSVQNSTLSGNFARYGGGIMNSGTATVSDSTLTGNSAEAGGGILNWNQLTVQNSTLSGNTATDNGTLTVQNSTLLGETFFGGGGIWNSGDVIIQSSTISGNSAASGGGLYTMSGTVQVLDSIIAGQQPGSYDCAGSVLGIHSMGHNIESESGCNFTQASDQQTVSNSSLNLQSLDDNGGPTQTMALGAGSVAIDKITLGGCTAGYSTDQRGAARANGVDSGGSACDIGAYEYDSIKKPNAVALTELAAAGWSPGAGLAALGAGLGAVLGGVAVWRRGGLEREDTKGRERHEARRSRSEVAGAAYRPPAVVYEAPLEARAGSPLSLPLEELIE
jgi:hypothetical protein